MRLFRRSPRKEGAARPRRERRTPSFREMRARLRTEKAEGKLLETEVRIHEEAARIRNEIRP